jgi:hypothetical protein
VTIVVYESCWILIEKSNFASQVCCWFPLFVSDRSSFSCVAGRVFLFVLSVSSSALNRVGFQFVLPTSSFLVRSSKPVPTRLFSCCCSLVCSVAATRFHLTAPLFDLPPTEFLSATGSFVAMTTLSPLAAEHASCASVPLPAGSLVPEPRAER